MGRYGLPKPQSRHGGRDDARGKGRPCRLHSGAIARLRRTRSPSRSACSCATGCWRSSGRRTALPAACRLADGCGSGQEPRGARPSMVLRGLIERGLLEMAETEAGPRCLFTEAGLAGLRAYFSRQPVDFRVLFPRLHHDLGLDELLGRGDRRG